jgi:hypothetical protein
MPALQVFVAFALNVLYYFKVAALLYDKDHPLHLSLVQVPPVCVAPARAIIVQGVFMIDIQSMAQMRGKAATYPGGTLEEKLKVVLLLEEEGPSDGIPVLREIG